MAQPTTLFNSIYNYFFNNSNKFINYLTGIANAIRHFGWSGSTLTPSFSLFRLFAHDFQANNIQLYTRIEYYTYVTRDIKRFLETSTIAVLQSDANQSIGIDYMALNNCSTTQFKELKQHLLEWYPDGEFLNATAMALTTSPRDAVMVFKINVENSDRVYYMTFIREPNNSDKEMLWQTVMTRLIIDSFPNVEFTIKPVINFLIDNLLILSTDTDNALKDLLYKQLESWCEFLKPAIQLRLLDPLLVQGNSIRKNYESDRARAKTKMNDALSDYEAYKAHYDEAIRKLYYFEMHGSGIEELKDYIAKYKLNNIELIQASNNYLNFYLKHPMVLKEKELQKLKDSPRENYVNRLDDARYQLLLDIARGEIIVNVIGIMSFDFTNDLYSVSNTSISLVTYNSLAVTNIHWNEYSCVGTLNAPMIEALQNKQYITAFELALNAVGVFNITDATVFSKFTNRLATGKYDLVDMYYKDGTKSNIKKYIKAYEKAQVEDLLFNESETDEGATPVPEFHEVGEVITEEAEAPF